jgi:hypothetical protein
MMAAIWNEKKRKVVEEYEETGGAKARCLDYEEFWTGWMDGGMDGWMDGWIDGWVDEWMDRWMVGWMDGIIVYLS